MANPTPNDALACALDLAAQGMCVFPCNSKKRPARPKKFGGSGLHDASCDDACVRQMWKDWPGTLVGVRTGASSRISVLDLDLQHDEAADWFAEFKSQLSMYRANETRSGGMHVLFQDNGAIRNSAGRVAKHVDVRGEGGYIIWWPAYGLGQINSEAPLTPMPDWLTSKLKPETKERRTPGEKSARPINDRYIGKAIERAYELVAMAPPGQRNDTLNRQTYSLARFIETGIITGSDIEHAMSSAGVMAGLEDREIAATIQSALRGRTAHG
ncbi:bifunctional DNA primase/polymerase [Kozakia baliensis]|uniref:bifunctional DNA primase/polymerase n=1 Tax=Kozakia baliensis TaxID=153496 RepID=UPI00049598BF|nr:bifunctional DNA primase/polymerase [Kozakia baliensis]